MRREGEFTVRSFLLFDLDLIYLSHHIFFNELYTAIF